MQNKRYRQSKRSKVAYYANILIVSAVTLIVYGLVLYFTTGNNIFSPVIKQNENEDSIITISTNDGSQVVPGNTMPGSNKNGSLGGNTSNIIKGDNSSGGSLGNQVSGGNNTGSNSSSGNTSNSGNSNSGSSKPSGGGQVQQQQQPPVQQVPAVPKFLYSRKVLLSTILQLRTLPVSPLRLLLLLQVLPAVQLPPDFP